MNIVLLTGHQYPVGTAQTNRVRSYLESLSSIGHCVQVIVYRPTENTTNIQNNAKGVLNGVAYQSSAKNNVKTFTNKYLARLKWIYSYINCIIILKGLQDRDMIDIVIQASSKSSLIPLVYLFCVKHKVKYVLENSEYPWFLLLKGQASNFIYRALYEHLYYKMFDGFLVMTQALCRYHQEYSRSSAYIFHLPMTVDMARFINVSEKESVITYIGNQSFYKDGVGILAEAFILIAKQYPGWKLRIIGDSGHDDKVRKIAKDAELTDRVETLGNVHRDEVPALLCTSKILALARPDNKQSEGGFPTKLGEYLATGNLVILTAVGEIPDYLVDGVSALIAVPDNVLSFADKLKNGIEHYDELGQVRLNGYQVCESIFNAKVQALRLSEYFIKLCDR